ncbi:DEAD/DEAH box helicase [Phlyctema vagabunda]|uniref:ATP-dependent RNA helicase n=1 Tax=Phlyctema vagabunda TaxID=108571 RepID=A0ABR4PD08_9HELO
MFNACKRGSASLTRVLRVASSRQYVPSLRTTTATSLSLRNTAIPAIGSRFLHLSSRLNDWAGESDGFDESVYQEEEVEKSIGKRTGPAVTRFDELLEHNLVHRNVVSAITKGMGHETMTEVQSATINQALEGTDIIAQARTGTGKTLGFLVPTIQNILIKSPELAEKKRWSKARPSDIRAIIMSPTRELAEQIAVEAEKLCQNTDLRVQVATGGNSKREMLRKMQREGCHLLVATPGRLNDLLTDPYSRVSAPDVNTLVLDEADRLLDSGFGKDVEAIIRLLPERSEVDRQTLLFSATVPRDVMTLVRKTLKPDFHFVQTVKAGDIATHEKIPQKLAAAKGFENYMPTLLELSKRELEAAAADPEKQKFKAIVYFNSTANVILADEIFHNLNESSRQFNKSLLHPATISCMHGQLTQKQRTTVSDNFRRAESAIMFSTDVTARGMDFPNVSHVIQMGLPPNRDQYVHRIGRTGRGDKSGSGWIVLAQAEMNDARRSLRGLPIVIDDSLVTPSVDMTRDAQLPAGTATILGQIGEATKKVHRRTKVAAYLGLLGQLKGHGATEMAQAVNNLARYGWGFEKPPAVSPNLASKIGISRVPGMNIGYAEPEDMLPPRQSSNYRGGDRNRGGFGGDRGGDRGFGGGRGGGFGGDRGGDRGFGGGRGGGFGGDRRSGGFGGDRGSNRGFGGDRNGQPGEYSKSRGTDRGFGQLRDGTGSW